MIVETLEIATVAARALAGGPAPGPRAWSAGTAYSHHRARVGLRSYLQDRDRALPTTIQRFVSSASVPFDLSFVSALFTQGVSAEPFFSSSAPVVATGRD